MMTPPALAPFNAQGVTAAYAEACRLLVQAYANSEAQGDGGSVDWDDADSPLERALREKGAVARKCQTLHENSKSCTCCFLNSGPH
jgi:hypothetical protein